MKILGIETSCDDTGVAILDSKEGLLAHTLFSQIDTHVEYGGVVPELASRDHITKISTLINITLKESNLNKEQLDAIAYTKGPGLSGSLLVGASFAKALAFSLKIPSIGIHHMEGHLLAPMLEDNKPEFPHLALLVSGGHTLLVNVKDFGDYEILGQSLDDAAGEAFDKTAKLLGLPYPGGPEIEKAALLGDNVYNFPKPLTNKPGLDFSFSGLKTFTLNTFNNSTKTNQDKANVARAFQEAIVDTIKIKIKRALSQTKLKSIVIAGGVGANKYLRNELQILAKNLNCKIFFPRLEFCTDNGAMIAYAGLSRFKSGFKEDLKIDVKPRWPITDIKI